MKKLYKNILITGGAGYCGSCLVPQLLEKGYKVTVFDKLYFGKNFLPLDNPNLRVVEGDIRDTESLKNVMRGQELVLSLACISNDASFELDEQLSTSINLDAFRPMVEIAKKVKVRRFIYASSSSVYGVSDKPNVTEEHPLVPLTLYNKYKGMCEPILNEYGDDDFTVVTFRPATVCGYAPRLRLDLSVNILTNHAVTNNLIKVFGGDQLRPNLDVRDYAEVCQLLMIAPHEKIQKNVFNVGYQNMSIMDIALLVKKVVSEEFPDKEEIKIVITPSNDNRSYHIDSSKILKVLGFSPKHTIEDAVQSLCDAFKQNKIPKSFENDVYYNIQTMKKIGAS